MDDGQGTQTDGQDIGGNAEKTLNETISTDFIIVLSQSCVSFMKFEYLGIASEKSHREKPFEGLQMIISEYDKNELTTEQKVYLLEGVFEYLDVYRV